MRELQQDIDIYSLMSSFTMKTTFKAGFSNILALGILSPLSMVILMDQAMEEVSSKMAEQETSDGFSSLPRNTLLTSQIDLTNQYLKTSNHKIVLSYLKI